MRLSTGSRAHSLSTGSGQYARGTGDGRAYVRDGSFAAQAGVCGIRKHEQIRKGVSAGTFERNKIGSHPDAPSGNPRSSSARRCYPTTPPRHLRLYRSSLVQLLGGLCQ
jgi:hypothetical protein